MKLDKLSDLIDRARWLSLDVVLGALVSAWAVWKLPDGHNQPPGLALVVLALAVFVIYTLDRLLDIRKPNPPDTPRHRFHAHYHRLLWGIVVGAGLLAGVLAWMLPPAIVLYGIKLGGIVGIYLLIVNRLRWDSFWLRFKEPLTGMLYVGGIWGPALAVHPPLSWIEWALCLMFAGVVTQNLVLFSWFEAQSDPRANNLSTWWGVGFSGDVLMVIFLLVSVGGVFTGIWAEAPYQRRMGLIEWGMSGLLWGVTFRPQAFARNDRYRWVGDGVFLLMGLLL